MFRQPSQCRDFINANGLTMLLDVPFMPLPYAFFDSDAFYNTSRFLQTLYEGDSEAVISGLFERIRISIDRAQSFFQSDLSVQEQRRLVYAEGRSPPDKPSAVRCDVRLSCCE